MRSAHQATGRAPSPAIGARLRLPLLLLPLLLAAGVACTRAGPPPSPAAPADLPPASTARPDSDTVPPHDASDSSSLPSSSAASRRPEGHPVPVPVPAGASAGGSADGAMDGVPLPGLRLPPVDEVRALWVVRTALLDPNSARTAVRRAHEAGFNTLLVQVRGRGDAYYRSRWEPRAETLAGQSADFDPLAVVLDEARVRGLAVHAWLNVHVVASARIPPRDPRHLALARPDLLAVPRDLATELLALDPHDPRYLERLRSWTLRNEERVEGIYTNPAHPDIAAHLARVIEDLLLEYPLDGLHLDYIRYPSAEFDYSRASLLAFHEYLRSGASVGQRGDAQAGRTRQMDGNRDRVEDPWDVATQHPERWDEFRRERVTATMERLFRTARAVRPDLVISAAVFPAIDDARASRYQPWTDWLERGIVDAVAPMAYTESPERFRRQIEAAVDVVGGARVWAGLGLYRTSFEGAVEQARIARATGAGGFALFSYDWAVGPDGARAARGGYLLRFADALWGGF